MITFRQKGAIIRRIDASSRETLPVENIQFSQAQLNITKNLNKLFGCLIHLWFILGSFQVTTEGQLNAIAVKCVELYEVL